MKSSTRVTRALICPSLISTTKIARTWRNARRYQGARPGDEALRDEEEREGAKDHEPVPEGLARERRKERGRGGED
jgi:hypothetical protein